MALLIISALEGSGGGGGGGLSNLPITQGTTTVNATSLTITGTATLTGSGGAATLNVGNTGSVVSAITTDVSLVASGSTGAVNLKINAPTPTLTNKYLTASFDNNNTFNGYVYTSVFPSIISISSIPATPVTGQLYVFNNGSGSAISQYTIVNINILGASLERQTNASLLLNFDQIYYDGNNWHLFNSELAAELGVNYQTMTIQINASDPAKLNSLNEANKYLNNRRLSSIVILNIETDLIETVESININHVDAWNIQINGFNNSTQYDITYMTYVSGAVGQQLITVQAASDVSSLVAGQWIVIYGEDDRTANIAPSIDNVTVTGMMVGCFKVQSVTSNTVTFINPQNMKSVLNSGAISLKMRRIAAISNNISGSFLSLNINANGLQIGNIAVVTNDNLTGTAGVNSLGLINIQDASIYLVGDAITNILAAASSSASTSNVNPIGFINANVGNDVTTSAYVGIISTCDMVTTTNQQETFITPAFAIYQSNVYLGSSTSCFIAGLGYINNNSRVTIDGSTNDNDYGTVFGSWYVDNGSSLNASNHICCNAQTYALLSNNNARVSLGQLDASTPANAAGYYSVYKNNGSGACYASGNSRMSLGTTMRALASLTSSTNLIYADQNASILIDNVGTSAITGYIDSSINSNIGAIQLDNASFQIINDCRKFTAYNHTGIRAFLGSAMSLINGSLVKIATATQNFLAANSSNFNGDILVSGGSKVFFKNNDTLINITTLTPSFAITQVTSNTIVATFSSNQPVNVFDSLQLTNSQGVIQVQYYTVTNIVVNNNTATYTIRESIDNIDTTYTITGYGKQAFLLPDDESFNNSDGLITGE